MDESSEGKNKTNQRAIMLKGGFLTANEASRRIGINAATVYRMVSNGKVEISKAGSLIYIKASSRAEHYKEAPPIVKRIMAGVEVQE